MEANEEWIIGFVSTLPKESYERFMEEAKQNRLEKDKVRNLVRARDGAEC
jgi:hypothetical protein